MTFRYGLVTQELDDFERTTCLITPLVSWKNRWRSLSLIIVAAKDVSFRMIDGLLGFGGDCGLDEALELGGDGGLYNDM